MSGIAATTIVDGCPVVVNSGGHVGITPDALAYKSIIGLTDSAKSNALLTVPVKDFTYTSSSVVQTGISCEDMPALLSDAVISSVSGPLALKWNMLIPLLLKGVQDLAATTSSAIASTSVTVASVVSSVSALTVSVAAKKWLPICLTFDNGIINLGTFTGLVAAKFSLRAGTTISEVQAILSATLSSAGECRLQDLTNSATIASTAFSGSSDLLMSLVVAPAYLNTALAGDIQVEFQMRRTSGLGNTICKSVVLY